MPRDDTRKEQRPPARVLVVCDDEPTARVLTRGLEEASFTAARVGYTRLDLRAVASYAALVLVGAEALAVCRLARQQRVDARIVVLASGSRFAAGAATDAGADGVMFEPIVVANLVAHLRRLLTQGAPPMRA